MIQVLNQENTNLFDALVPDVPCCLTVIGGGGKTTVVTSLAEEAQRRRIPALLTTTTHMRRTADVDLSGDKRTILRKIEENSLCFCGLPAPNGKIKGLSPALFAELSAQVELTLTEGDGSRGLPLKYPAEHEPVIPPETSRLVLVVGMSALNRPLREVCHRWELSGLEGDSLVTPDLAAEVLRRGYLRRFSPEALTVIFHQCDSGEESRAAECIAKVLSLRDCLITKRR